MEMKSLPKSAASKNLVSELFRVVLYRIMCTTSDVRVSRHHSMEAYDGVETKLHTFLATQFARRSGRFIRGRKANSRAHWMEGWNGSRAGLDVKEGWKFPSFQGIKTQS